MDRSSHIRTMDHRIDQNSAHNNEADMKSSIRHRHHNNDAQRQHHPHIPRPQHRPGGVHSHRHTLLQQAGYNSR